MLFYQLNEQISQNKVSLFLKEGIPVLSSFTK